MKKITAIILIMTMILPISLFAQSDEELLEYFIQNLHLQVDHMEDEWNRTIERAEQLGVLNAEMQILLDRSRETIDEMQRRLNSAIRGVNDGFEAWLYVDGLLTEARRDLALAQSEIVRLSTVIDNWEIEHQRILNELRIANRAKTINFSFGIGIGATAAYGFTDLSNERGGFYAIGAAGIGTGIWLLGKFFNWW